MNLIQLTFSIYLINGAFIFFLVYSSKKKHDSNLIFNGIAFLLPITAWAGMVLQDTFHISEISNRQILVNILLTMWAFKFLIFNKNLKFTILSYLINKDLQLRGVGVFQKIKNFLIFLNFIIISFFPVISLNFLSGNLGLNLLDITAALIFLLGLGYEIKALFQLKKIPSTEHPETYRKGLWRFSRHPDLFGQLISWWGLYFIALGAYGGEWSIFGPIFVTTVYLKLFVANIEEKLNNKFKDYKDYRISTPSIVPKITFYKI